MDAASVVWKRAASIGTMTSSHAASIIDSCASTEYAEAGRGMASAASSTSVAMLQRRVMIRSRRRIGRGYARTLGEMLCNQNAAQGFAFGVARKPEQTTAVLERHDDVPGGAAHRGDLAPRETEVNSSEKLQPAARQ